MATIENGESALSVRSKLNVNLAAQEANTTKLADIEADAEVNPTNAETKTAYEANANTNAFTDADSDRLDLADISIGRAYMVTIDVSSSISVTGGYNTFIGTMVWTDSGTGEYTLTSGSREFSLSNTMVCLVGNSNATFGITIGTSAIVLTAYNSSGVAAANLFTALKIEVKNYNS